MGLPWKVLGGMGTSTTGLLGMWTVLAPLLLSLRGVLANVNDEMEVHGDLAKTKTHLVDSLDLLIYLLLLFVTILTLWVFKRKRVMFLHESGLSVLIGLVVGAILRFTGRPNSALKMDVTPVNSSSVLDHPPDILRMNISDKYQFFGYRLIGLDNDEGSRFTEIQEKVTFDSELFFFVILPPIIFHAGYSMRKKQFFDNLGSILTFALFGTIISTFVIASIMWLIVQCIGSLDVHFLDTLYFGAIISATDPVTILAVFHDLHVDPLVNGLVLGESLLNDAVSIVLCGALEDYSALIVDGEPDSFQTAAFFWTIINFFTIFLGSLAIGASIGIITALITKFTRIRDLSLLETSIFFLLSYSSYLIAEIAQTSGIVSILFCGIFQAHYTFHNLSAESKLRTRQLFELLNFLLENFIFSYIGVSMFTFSHHKFHFGFIFGAFFAILVARAANIYPLSALLNLGRGRRIPLNYQHMLCFSGLRGAMAFALAIQNTVTEARQVFLTTTSLIAIVTVIFCGGATQPLLKALHIPVGVGQPGEPGEEGGGHGGEEGGAAQQVLDGNDGEPRSLETGVGQVPKSRSSLARGWGRLDRNLLKPLLTNCPPSLQETLPWLGSVATFLTPLEQMVGRRGQDPDQRICTSESQEIRDGDGEEGGWAGGEVGVGGGGGAQRGGGGGESGGKSPARRDGELSAGD